MANEKCGAWRIIKRPDSNESSQYYILEIDCLEDEITDNDWDELEINRMVVLFVEPLEDTTKVLVMKTLN